MKKPIDKRNETIPNTRVRVFVYCMLAVFTMAIYWPVRGFEFISVDDEQYVTGNHMVQLGLTIRTISWAFTHFHSANWHPLTWISHALDVSIYGFNPGGHHLTSMLFHTVNSLLLLSVLSTVTGNFWRSAFVAALFALHPLHVESVAWVSERKDVLSTFFFMFTLLAYAAYARKPSAKRMTLVTTALGLGLMSKPMLVSVPLLLLMVDYWPLKRFVLDKPWLSQGLKLLIEKWPLVALSAASCVVTYLAQKSGNAIDAEIAIGPRLANAAVSYVMYIAKMIWPSNLAMMYPHPETRLPVWQVLFSAVALVLTTYGIARFARRAPCIAFGWAWFVVSLLPVIGIVQVGAQGIADRYTYIPLIGLFVAIAWAIPGLDIETLTHKKAPARKRNPVYAIAAIFVVLVLSIVTNRQIGFWRNEVIAWEHATKVTSANAIAYANLSQALAKRGRLEEAEKAAVTAYKIRPNYLAAVVNLGGLKMMRGDLKGAKPLIEKAVAIDPNNTEARNNLGVLLARQGKLDEAIKQFREALRRNPGDAGSTKNLERALGMKKNP